MAPTEAPRLRQDRTGRLFTEEVSAGGSAHLRPGRASESGRRTGLLRRLERQEDQVNRDDRARQAPGLVCAQGAAPHRRLRAAQAGRSWLGGIGLSRAQARRGRGHHGRLCQVRSGVHGQGQKGAGCVGRGSRPRCPPAARGQSGVSRPQRKTAQPLKATPFNHLKWWAVQGSNL
ncbi:hypothetical protein [Lysobacter gummosus]|uniref:hypothetical protein n=1 Tax=Lysobacter gummosus TaxID=262324 RepID=UPI0036427CC0